MSVPRKQLWPYDEVTISGDAQNSGPVTVATPWLKVKLDIAGDDRTRVLALGEKISGPGLDGSDLDDVQWFFQSLAQYPLNYILPRAEKFGIDEHRVDSGALPAADPGEMLRAICAKSGIEQNIERFLKRARAWKWTWDIDAALEFSRSAGGHDPEALFSVARRFHLLNDIENNKTGEMLEHVRGLKADTDKFKKASALIVRQNHYITQQCDSVLKAALPKAQNAFEAVQEFIQAESGHDKIMEKAIRSLGLEAKDVPAIDTVIVLMELFREIGKRNFLAFSMVVDIFERTSYGGGDPLAGLLRAGGLETAARQADIHRDINDSGGHENVALGFLADMRAIDPEYATEALKLAELLTLTIHQLSVETLDIIRG